MPPRPDDLRSARQKALLHIRKVARYLGRARSDGGKTIRKQRRTRAIVCMRPVLRLLARVAPRAPRPRNGLVLCLEVAITDGA